MSIRIYSGKINVTSSDDGINAAGGRSTNGDDRPSPLRNLKINEGPKPLGGCWNSCYFISIYGGEVNVFCSCDGLDSNGNIFIHGGDINFFSKETGDNEPMGHDGNLTLYSASVLGVGSRSMEYVQSGITKGNQMHVYCAAKSNLFKS